MMLRQNCQSYQEVQSLYSLGHGGFGGTGLGHGIFTGTTGHQVIPDLNTDFIYSALAQELGLVGAAALLLLYMAFVLRGFRIALAASDGFSKLLAAGLSFGFAFQTFVIVGGITRVIPLTGITLPFVSYGGSSVIANFLLVAGLMLISHRANRAGGGRVNKQLLHVSVAALVLLAALIVSTTYWQTWAVGDLADKQDNAIQLVSRLTVDRGKILGAGGTVLATNRRSRKHGLTLFTRRYPSGTLAPQVIGYATPAGTTTGLEQTLDDYLTGANTNLTNTFKEELRKLGNQTVHGNNVFLTLRPGLQALALQHARKPLRSRRRPRREDRRDLCDGIVADVQRKSDREAKRLREDPQDQGNLRRLRQPS